MCNRTEKLCARCGWTGLGILLAATFWTGLADVAGADPLLQVVRVEEDWELVVGTPDSDSVAPQVSSLISPVGDLESVHAAFELNHQSMPEFVAGGLQLQIWNGELPVASRKFPNGGVMRQADETVTWTQSMELSDGSLTFQITGGNSTSWGGFGGQGYLTSTVESPVADLNGYNPAVSVSNAGVSYAANRVQSFVLRRVRLTLATGEVLEDDTARSVYQQQQ